MNIQLAQVISDVAGETGQRIIPATLAGERDGHTLAKLKHVRIRASEADIAKALQGNWREERLFALKQAVALYNAYAGQLDEYDCQLVTSLAELARADSRTKPNGEIGRRLHRASTCAATCSSCAVWT